MENQSGTSLVQGIHPIKGGISEMRYYLLAGVRRAEAEPGLHGAYTDSMNE